jgi:transposase
VARRHALRDDQWERVERLLPGRKETVGVTAKDNRLFVEAVLYRYRAGIPWRDLPERFGPWKAVHPRFSRRALGNPTGLLLTPGQASDLEGADALSSDLKARALLADKAYDADERALDPLRQAGKTAVIPPKRNRVVQRSHDRELCKERHLIESFFCKLKQYRAIASRHDKTARHFLAAIYLASTVIWLN